MADHSTVPMNTFSIEDAFEDDDQMKVYCSTTENIPLATKKANRSIPVIECVMTDNLFIKID